MTSAPRLVVVGVVALLLGACTQGDDDDAPATVEGASRGGTLRVATALPASIDPQNAFEPAGQMVVQTMCDPLIAIDSVTGELKPAIAESWSITDRGKKINLRIRKNARFSNGDKVTADDVRFSLTRLASADYASFVSDLMRPVKGYAFVHGDEKTDNDEKLRNIEGVHVVENRSVEIELAAENAEWIRVLTHPAASPVPRDVAERQGDDFASSPVCAGPYRLEKPWSGDGVLALVRSEHYAASNHAHTAGGAGWADRVEFHPHVDLAAQWEAYRQGAVDVAQVPQDALADVRATMPAHLHDLPAPGVEYVGVPANDARLGNVDVRRALSAALDRQRLVEDVYAGSRHAATSFISPVLGSYASRPDACEQIDPAADVEGARRALATSGVDLTSAPVKLHFNDELGNRRLMEAVAQQWRDNLGLQVELAPAPWEAFSGVGIGATGFDGPFRFSWSPDFPSAEQYLSPLFASEGVGASNFSRWSDPAFDRVLERNARSALEEADRAVEFRRLEDIACKEVPLIPLVFDYDQFVVRPEVVLPAGTSIAAYGLGGISLRDVVVTAR